MSSTWLTVVRTDTSRVWTSSWIHFDAKWIINVNCLRWGRSRNVRRPGISISLCCVSSVCPESNSRRVLERRRSQTQQRGEVAFFFSPPLPCSYCCCAKQTPRTRRPTQSGRPAADLAMAPLSISAGAQPHLPLTAAAAASPADGTWTPAGQILVSLTAGNGNRTIFVPLSEIQVVFFVVHDEIFLWGFWNQGPIMI